MAYNATTWTEKSNPSWHARFGLVGAAAMHDLHVIQGPNVTRDAKIAFFAFHAFVVEDSRFQQNRVRTKLYNCGACVCKSNVEIRIADSFCRPQLILAWAACTFRIQFNDIQSRILVITALIYPYWDQRNLMCCWSFRYNIKIQNVGICCTLTFMAKKPAVSQVSVNY